MYWYKTFFPKLGSNCAKSDKKVSSFAILEKAKNVDVFWVRF